MTDLSPYDDLTISTVTESIETNLLMAEQYHASMSPGVAAECTRAAWQEYIRYRDVLLTYIGAGECESLCCKIVQVLVREAREESERVTQ